MRALRTAIFAITATLVLSGPSASQPVSPEAVAAARELVVTMRADEQLKKVLPVIFQQLKPVIVQGRPELERDYDLLTPMMIEGMTARIDDFVAAVATIYARNFSVDELREITAFYRGKAGQKFVQAMPAITQQSLAMGQQFGQEVARELQDRIIKELRKRGHKI
jgi:hypothetical protein